MELEMPKYEPREMQVGDKHPAWPWWRVQAEHQLGGVTRYRWLRLDGLASSWMSRGTFGSAPVQGGSRSEVGPDLTLWCIDRDRPLLPDAKYRIGGSHVLFWDHPPGKPAQLTDEEYLKLVEKYDEVRQWWETKAGQGVAMPQKTAFSEAMTRTLTAGEVPPGMILVSAPGAVGVITGVGDGTGVPVQVPAGTMFFKAFPEQIPSAPTTVYTVDLPPSAKMVEFSVRGVMGFNAYQERAVALAIYPDQGTFLGLWYCATGTDEERGEILGKVKKHIRDVGKFMTPELQTQLKKEIGDECWYLANVAHEAGLTLQECVEHNLEKLQDRKARGKLGGSGDDR